MANQTTSRLPATRPADESSLSLPNSTAISLTTLFQVVTACGVFFACLRFSPPVAIIGTIFVAPAVIRTGLAAELHHRHHLPFGWITRCRYFLSSLILALVTLLLATSISIAVTAFFALSGLGVGWLLGSGEHSLDAAVVGTAGGMIWGIAAGLVAFGFIVSKYWELRVNDPGADS